MGSPMAFTIDVTNNGGTLGLVGNELVLPRNGNSSPTLGSIRFNTDTGGVEVYQSDIDDSVSWLDLRYITNLSPVYDQLGTLGSNVITLTTDVSQLNNELTTYGVFQVNSLITNVAALTDEFNSFAAGFNGNVNSLVATATTGIFATVGNLSALSGQFVNFTSGFNSNVVNAVASTGAYASTSNLQSLSGQFDSFSAGFNSNAISAIAHTGTYATASNLSAISNSFGSFVSGFDGNVNAVYQDNITAITTNVTSLTSRVTNLEAISGPNTAGIYANLLAISNNVASLSSEFTLFTAGFDGNVTNTIASTGTYALASNVSSLSSQFNNFVTGFGTNVSATVNSNIVALSSGYNSLSGNFNNFVANFNGNVASATSGLYATSDNLNALSQQVTTLTATFGGNSNTSIVGNVIVLANNVAALTSSFNNFVTNFNSNVAIATTGLYATSGDFGALSGQFNNFVTGFSSNVSASANSNIVALTAGNIALSRKLDTLTASFNSNVASFTSNILVLQTANSSVSTQLTQLQSNFNSNATTISQQATTLNGLSGQYSVKIDTNGRIAGFGLSNTSNAYNGSVNSKFVVNADAFEVWNGVSASPTFSINGTDLVFNGKMSASSLYIGTIPNSVIGTGSITASKLAQNDSSFNIDPYFTDSGYWTSSPVNSWYLDTSTTGTSLSTLGALSAATLYDGVYASSIQASLSLSWGATARAKVVAGEAISLRAYGFNNSSTNWRTFAYVNFWGGNSDNNWAQYIGSIQINWYPGDGPSYQERSGIVPPGAVYVDWGVSAIQQTGGVWGGIAGITNLQIVRPTTTTQIADGAITTDKITANAITAGKIAVGAITADTIATGNINASTTIHVGSNMCISGPSNRIVVNDGTRDRVYLGALPTGGYGINIYDNSGNPLLTSGGLINYNCISNTPTLGSLASLSSIPSTCVSGLGGLASASQVNLITQVVGQLASSNVSGLGSFATLQSKLSAANIGTYMCSAAIGAAYIGNLNASCITTGVLNADRINAGSITTSKINIVPGNINLDPYFADAAAWTNSTGSNISPNNGWYMMTSNYYNNIQYYLGVPSGMTLLDSNSPGTGSASFSSKPFPVTPNNYITIRAKGVNGSPSSVNRSIYAVIVFLDANSQPVNNHNNDITLTWPSNTAASYLEKSQLVPANAATMYFGGYVAVNGNAWSGYAGLSDLQIIRPATTASIVAGAVTSGYSYWAGTGIFPYRDGSFASAVGLINYDTSAPAQLAVPVADVTQGVLLMITGYITALASGVPAPGGGGSGGSADWSGGGTSCFLAGTMVAMADGTFKAIETIVPGDTVIGAFGEINMVLALDFVTLGNRWMYNINDEHWTSDDHPHVSADGKFYSPEPDKIYKEWGRVYTVITNDGNEQWVNIGLQPGRVNTLVPGVTLQTLFGPKLVETISQVVMDPNTRLYNLVIDNSHTYTVDGYAVTGWPREDNWDYDTWQAKSITLTKDDYLSHPQP